MHSRKRKVRDLSYTERRRDWDASATPMKNAKSGKVALCVRARDSLLDDGTTRQRFQLIRPARVDHIDAAALAESNWSKIGDKAFARLWSAEAEEARHALDEDTLFIATGLLLPVWRKIPARMLSVVRIAAADGRSILGRVVDAGDLGALCEGMGLAVPSLSVPAMIANARGGARIAVYSHDQLTLKASRVAGSQRLEITGAHAARLGWYKAKGCYTEIIAWKTRLFLPDATAEAILTAICAANQNAVPAQA